MILVTCFKDLSHIFQSLFILDEVETGLILLAKQIQNLDQLIILTNCCLPFLVLWFIRRRHRVASRSRKDIHVAQLKFLVLIHVLTHEEKENFR